MSRTVIAKRIDPADHAPPDSDAAEPGTGDADPGTLDTDPGSVDAATAEIRALAESAGYEVVDELTQARTEDPGTNLGRGAVGRLAELVGEHDARCVVLDNELTPKQAFSLAEALPDGVVVKDRFRLILDVFREGCGTKEARLQVRLAELEYELPRLRAAIRADQATEITIHDEEGKQIEDHKRQIDEVKRKLNRLRERERSGADRHERRREQGLALVALAGYTNAGKSTLLRRLADDLSLESSGADDLAESATVEDRLFETLGTTTRRATVRGRATVVTDTVGFISDLPTELVESFESTLDAVHHADVVLLVVDASQDPATAAAKTRTAADHLSGDGAVVPVLNKCDRVDDDHLAAVRRTVQDAVPGFDASPVVASATEGIGLGALRARIRAALPEDGAAFALPNDGETMRFVSWAYDNATVESVDYEAETVTVALRGHPRVVERARRRAADLGAEPTAVTDADADAASDASEDVAGEEAGVE